jgi:Fe-S-cluster-containing hydrogenase component 2
MPGVTIKVSDLCIGCGTCNNDICFVSAIHMSDGHSVINEACRGCGRCVTICPEGAIEIFIETDQFVEKSIDRISSLVDVS